MYIRIDFDNIENDKTKDTLELFLSSPIGMFLHLFSFKMPK
jgi:hypothetical protein